MTLPHPPLIDTHCHLDYVAVWEGTPEGVDRSPGETLKRAQTEGVQWIINPSVEPQNFQDVLALADAFPQVRAAIAVHPNDVKNLHQTPQWQEQLESALTHPMVVAVGETGLDYYRGESPEEIAQQQEAFRYHLALAQTKGLPVIIHDREAHQDIYQIVQEFPGITGVMHCFSGDGDFALQMVDLGFYISFAGNITFKNAQGLRDAAKVVPKDRILIETDAPFLTPVPFRGQVNEPARVRHVAETLAEVFALPYDTVAQITTNNACRLFGLPQ